MTSKPVLICKNGARTMTGNRTELHHHFHTAREQSWCKLHCHVTYGPGFWTIKAGCYSHCLPLQANAKFHSQFYRQITHIFRSYISERRTCIEHGWSRLLINACLFLCSHSKRHCLDSHKSSMKSIAAFSPMVCGSATLTRRETFSE